MWRHFGPRNPRSQIGQFGKEWMHPRCHYNSKSACGLYSKTECILDGTMVSKSARVMDSACALKIACGTLAPGAPSASLPRSGRSAPSLRPLRSVASGARLARFGRSARSRRALRSLPPRARASGLMLFARFARSQHSALALARVGRSLRALRSLASRPPLARLAPSAPSLRGLRSVAPRPPLGRSALSAPSARSFAL